MQKLEILGEAARYDASCASSGCGRSGSAGTLGSARASGICHSWTDDGRCVSLLKVLYSNACVYDCAYCANRCSSNVPRATFEPDELAQLVVEFYRRNYIEGLFLSSGVLKNPDYTMELILKTVTLIRTKYLFRGYIHVKVIPGTDARLVGALGLMVDRVSINMELPSKESLALLAPQKKPEAIIAPMKSIRTLQVANADERKLFRFAPTFAPAGQATQLIVGATPENDYKILTLSAALYKKFELKRVYYSAYLPVGTHPSLPAPDVNVPLAREHRLYQADWLCRFYKFDVGEIISEQDGFLDTELDPKCAWALKNRHIFPVDINTASYEMLLRIPGVGVLSAQRIMGARRQKRLTLEDVRKVGLVWKRAQYFVTAQGLYHGKVFSDSPYLREALVERQSGQLSLFDPKPVFAGLPGTIYTSPLLAAAKLGVG